MSIKITNNNFLYLLEPQWKVVHTFNGNFDSSNIQHSSFIASYGSANNTKLTLNIEKGSNDITKVNVTICLQRKVNV